MVYIYIYIHLYMVTNGVVEMSTYLKSSLDYIEQIDIS